MNTTRGYACEYVAWRFVAGLSAKERIDFLLWELPRYSFETASRSNDLESVQPRSGNGRLSNDEETAPLLSSQATLGANEEAEGSAVNGRLGDSNYQETQESDDFAAAFANLSALEVAAVSDAKKFLSQRVIQRMIESIWRGEIVFWETLGVSSEKEAKVYNSKCDCHPRSWQSHKLMKSEILGSRIRFVDYAFHDISRLSRLSSSYPSLPSISRS